MRHRHRDEKLNRGDGEIIIEGYVFKYTKDSTVGDVIDTIYEWAEKTALGDSHPYWQLAEEFEIHPDDVRDIEEDVYY